MGCFPPSPSLPAGGSILGSAGMDLPGHTLLLPGEAPAAPASPTTITKSASVQHPSPAETPTGACSHRSHHLPHAPPPASAAQTELQLRQRSPTTPQLGTRHEGSAPGCNSEPTSSCQGKEGTVFIFTRVVLAEHLHASVRDPLPTQALHPCCHSTAPNGRVSPTQPTKLGWLSLEAPGHGKQLVNMQLSREDKSKQLWLFLQQTL